VLFIRSYDDLTFRDDVKPLTKPLPKRLALLQPLDAPRRLTAELVARLTADITSGKLPPGSRLPTEQEMIAATGVSRTVIREAVAALRADRLVVRQGVGDFVASHVRRPFRVDFDERSSLREVLNVMELRTGVEIEAAGLAAERTSPAQLKKIVDKFNAIQAAIDGGEMRVLSMRISPFIVRLPPPPEIRNLPASWNISAVSSSRADQSGMARPLLRVVSNLTRSRRNTSRYSRRSRVARFRRPARPCNTISSTVTSAIRSSRASTVLNSLHHISFGECTRDSCKPF
jgi:DNA-binding transcriptional regulator YhcF (GntR family)